MQQNKLHASIFVVRFFLKDEDKSGAQEKIWDPLMGPNLERGPG
jgi:hypothetical protein